MTPSPDFRVYWSMLQDRALYDKAAQSFVRLASHCGRLGYGLIAPPYMRTDIARNVIVRSFKEETNNPMSILIMLDGDHDHPVDLVERLVATMLAYNDEAPELNGQRMGVLGALYFRRAAPFDPLFFKRAEGGGYMTPVDFDDNQVYESDHVGTGAIAIRRWVFDALHEYDPIYFEYEYDHAQQPEDQPGEDTAFAKRCEKAGIVHWVHTGIVTDHLRLSKVGREEWEAYKQSDGSLYAGIDAFMKESSAASRIAVASDETNLEKL